MTIQEQLNAAKQHDWITVNQLALMLQYDPETIYRWVKRGKIPGAQKFGRTIRFQRAIVTRWSDYHKKPTE